MFNVKQTHFIVLFFDDGMWNPWRCVCLSHLESFDQRSGALKVFVLPLQVMKPSLQVFPDQSWIRLHPWLYCGAVGRRQRRLAAGLLCRAPELWGCSSVGERWSKVNGERLIYTAVITLAFSSRGRAPRWSGRRKWCLRTKKELFFSLVVKLQKQEDGERREKKGAN